MKLPAKQFAQLFESLGSMNRSTLDRDKRRAARLEYQTILQVIPVASGKQSSPINVTIKDFSSRGIRILHNAPFTQGSQFIARIPRNEATPVSILCTVVHLSRGRNDLFSIGAEFTCVLPDSKEARGDTQDQAIKHISDSIFN